MWDPYKNEAFKRARVGKNQYRCRMCGGIRGRKEMRADHVVPVIDPTEGFKGIYEMFRRMFPPSVDGYQIICQTPCHDEKTARERELRTAARRAKQERGDNATSRRDA